jgi:hypothetical protein
VEAAGCRGRPSERTLIACDELWRLYIAPKLKDHSLNTITRADVEHVVRAAAKRSAWRAQDALKVLRRLLSAAVDAEAIARNPATRVATPKIEQERPWVLTMDEVDALAEEVPDRYRALVLLAAYGSLRWSELVALRANQNVSALSIAAASALLNQFLSLVVAPSGMGDPGPLMHSLATHRVRPVDVSCVDGCPYALSVGDGDRRLDPTGPHDAACRARTAD